jgi:endonuclease VIII
MSTGPWAGRGTTLGAMPEGHSSHRNAGLFGDALVGRELVRVDAPAPRVASHRFEERLPGEVVSGAEAVGKHHLLRFESGRLLHSHLLMSGIWRLRRAGERHSRSGLFLALHTAAHSALLYRCPTVRLFEPGEPLPPFLLATGPDLLDCARDPGADMVAALMAAEAHRTVGDALMDQRLVAGIGNVYKSETCFLCGVDPWRRLDALSVDDARALGETAGRLLADGVSDRGAIRTYRPTGAPPWSRERTWVYGRRGRPCRRCGTTIRSRGQGDANRTTYWCPTCQR